MSAIYIVFNGKTKEEAEQKAREEIKKIDFMRQPMLESVVQKEDGTWKATIKHWGLD